ncbi:MAG: response regulator transcription factor [Saprospiraceae bacterium]|nr:response regulator transcription factor [Saprospiraceae bacterium]
MTALIVEDMPQAAEALEKDLAEFCPDVRVLDKAGSIVAAAKALRQQTPDIIFLDILLGDGTGFDLLDIFPDITSRVVFITASEEHALRAFRYAAVDYLLKPVNPNELKEAVARARVRVAGARESLELLRDTIRKPADALPTRISLASQERISVVDISDLVRCESDGNNTWFILKSGEKIFVTRTMKQFEQLLEQHGFMRVHQSHLVQMSEVREFQKRDGGYLKLKNGELVPVSVRKKTEVLEAIEKW